MLLSADIEIEPAFYDLDPMNVVWHGNYFRYFEIVRDVLLSKIDYSYQQMFDSGYSWPIIDTRVKYIRSLRLGQKAIVSCQLIEYENRLLIEYQIKDAQTGQRVVKAHTVQVAVDLKSGEMCLASPSILLQKLGIAV
jgi:acyl-CoA thioester hydrolase